jgi:hypothetical protein
MADIKILDLTTATEITETTDYIPVVDTSDTAQDSTGTTKKATVRKLLGDRVLPDTIVGTTETQTLSNKTLTSPVINTPTGDVVTPTGTQTLTNKTLSTGSVIDANVNVVEVLKKAYPIGSVYINASNATNPASLLGFGTWSAFGAGKVMVGLDAGDTEFDTIGETGGAKTHKHDMSSGQADFSSEGTTGYVRRSSTSFTANRKFTISGDATDSTTRTVSTQIEGNTDTISNLQPYIVVYFWKRTA